MKYGDSLRKRSTYWRVYNLDYDHIKKHIKQLSLQTEQTLEEHAEAEDELFHILLEELDKVCQLLSFM
jgi:hypothetical protein